MSPDYANLIADFGLTNTQPLYLDDNNVLEYTLQVLELLKFSLWVLVFGGEGSSDISIINRYLGDAGPTHITIVNLSLDLKKRELINEFLL